MDTVTYPNKDVRKELEHWVFGKVDISEFPDVAKTLKVHGIPVAIALKGDGSEVGRVLGFVEPEEFNRQISSFRSHLKDNNK